MIDQHTLSLWIPIGSLAVAVLAVFVGPLISWRIAKRQSESSQQVASEQIEASIRVATKQIIAPMRQAWIERLRDRVAEIQSIAIWYYVSGTDENVSTSEEEELETEAIRVERKLLFLSNQVELMINPNEDDHIQLVKALAEVRSAAFNESGARVRIDKAVENANLICSKILKREWERVKNEV